LLCQAGIMFLIK